MSQLIASAITVAPFILFALLVIESFRTRPSAADDLPIELFTRSYGA